MRDLAEVAAVALCVISLAILADPEAAGSHIGRFVAAFQHALSVGAAP